MSTNTYYLHFRLMKNDTLGKSQPSTYSMDFWTNNSRHNTQIGPSHRGYAVAQREFASDKNFAYCNAEMKRSFDAGLFDNVKVMTDLTVKDLKMMGVGWRI